MSGLFSNAICRTPTTEPPENLKILGMKKTRSDLRRRNSAVQIDRSTRSAGHVQKLNSKANKLNKYSCDRLYRFLAFYVDKNPVKKVRNYDSSPTDSRRISMVDDFAENTDCKKRLSFESPRKTENDIADLQNLLENTTLYANPEKIAKLNSINSRINAPPNTPVTVRVEEPEEMIEDFSN